MLRIINRSFIALSVLSAIGLSTNAMASAQLCSWGAGSPRASLNDSINFSVSARSTSGVSQSIPVNIYYSQDASLGNDIKVGSTSVYSSNGSCSSIAQVYATIPSDPIGLGCFPANQNGYYLFSAGSDLKTTSVKLTGPANLPEITSVSPAAAQPGMPIRVYGSGFTQANTAVFFGNVQASRAVISDTELFVLVPQGASSSSIEVRHYEGGAHYCVPPASSTSFTVQAPSCNSGASYNGYGNIASFANYTATGCANYTDNMAIDFVKVAKGNSLTIPFQLGTCGQPDYSKLLKVYVDWNQDSTFDEVNELALAAPSIAGNTGYNLNVNVPQTATAGNVKARMIMALYYNGTVDSTADVTACGNYPFGETMDFTLQISPNSEGVMVAEIADKASFETGIQALHAKQHAALTQQQPVLDSGVTPLQDANIADQSSYSLSYPTMGPQERIVVDKE